MCRLSRNLGASTSWKTQGLSRPVQGLLYLYFYLCLYLFWINSSLPCIIWKGLGGTVWIWCLEGKGYRLMTFFSWRHTQTLRVNEPQFNRSKGEADLHSTYSLRRSKASTIWTCAVSGYSFRRAKWASWNNPQRHNITFHVSCIFSNRLWGTQMS